MKTRETKQKDLAALTESLAASKSAMVVSFTKLTVTKDQEFRRSLREAGASYQVVKNTLARIAVKGTQFEETTEHLKGVTAIAWTENDPVVLSKAISKFMKDNADIYTFKTGVVDGKLVDLKQLTTIANLPSKEELMSKLLWVLNSSAQRLVTVINAVPRDLAIVIKQIGDKEDRVAAAPAAEAKAEEPVAAPVAEETAPVEAEVSGEAPAAEATAVEEVTAESVTEPAADAVPAAEVEAAPAAEESPAAEADAADEDILELPSEEKAE
jgi:large subunit ribosomal protein L10